MECPKCGGTRVARSRRSGFYERVVLDLVSFLPFRCEQCLTRFYRRRPGGRRSDDDKPDVPASVWLLKLVITIAVAAAALFGLLLALDSYMLHKER